MENNTASLEDGKLAQLEAFRHDYLASLEFDVEFNGSVYQAGETSYARLLSVLPVELPVGFYWVDKGNNKVPLTKENLVELASVIQAKRFEMFVAYQDRKDQIRSATQMSELFLGSVSGSSNNQQ